MKNLKYILLAVALVGIVGAVAYGMGRGRGSTEGPVTTEPTPAPGPIGGNPGGCVVGGCSGEVCSDEKDGPAMSNCIFRAEFACYKEATCERQADGACGWTQTPALKACLNSPPPVK